MRTILRNKTIFKSAALRKGDPLSKFNVVSYKRPGTSLSLENTTLYQDATPLYQY